MPSYGQIFYIFKFSRLDLFCCKIYHFLNFIWNLFVFALMFQSCFLSIFGQLLVKLWIKLQNTTILGIHLRFFYFFYRTFNCNFWNIFFDIYQFFLLCLRNKFSRILISDWIHFFNIRLFFDSLFWWWWTFLFWNFSTRWFFLFF